MENKFNVDYRLYEHNEPLYYEFTDQDIKRIFKGAHQLFKNLQTIKKLKSNVKTSNTRR